MRDENIRNLVNASAGNTLTLEGSSVRSLIKRRRFTDMYPPIDASSDALDLLEAYNTLDPFRKKAALMAVRKLAVEGIEHD